MHISIVGLGFVGLTTAACLADRGIRVSGIDIDADKVRMISAGQAPFYEEGLIERLRRTLKRKTLSLSNDFSAIPESSVTFVTVGTPSNKDGSANLSYIVEASESIGRAIKDKKVFHVVAIKSTVPPGTALEVAAPAIERTSGKQRSKGFGICSNPEFLREGSAVVDTLNPDRVVVGALDARTKKAMLALYKKFYGSKKVTVVDANPQTAELIKYANNSFLATKISFINTIANICQHIPGTDVAKVAHAIGLDRRIGPMFLKAGLGYGGSCFPKDVTAIINLSESRGYSPDLLKDTHSINQLQPYKAIELLKRALPDLSGKTISILGLAFKADTTDMREAVSLKIIDELKKAGANIKVHDPMAIEEARKILGDTVTYSKTMEECLTGSNGCIIVTEWKQYARISPATLRKHMQNSIIVDGRRVTKPEGFIGKVQSYAAIGYGSQ
ncbi:UDP-glucose/GDP-mannose dehydrogenase family protein [Nitrososphaera sp.]|uniref:UDP-glucose dehydrogenase family protein n=1 Tax=Nitrososphaera sp. TaxID=1971748 RepID=UPI00317C6086